MSSDPEIALQIATFKGLFTGYPNAYGTGAGGWVHEKPNIHVFATHVMGKGPGLGIGPLMEDGTCRFAAIDLDRPDFELAGELAKLLPGCVWVERSRSGNAHILAFFSEPIAAWVPRGIMREALAAFGEKTVEVFPKSDSLHPGMVGNYLNLPYFGDTRPVVGWTDPPANIVWTRPAALRQDRTGLSFAEFVELAAGNLNDPMLWETRAHWLGIPSPQERELSERREYGTSPNLHRCAAYIIEHRDDNPITEGHRAAVFFALAKMLSNWSEIDHEEALGMMTLVNDASPDPIPTAELNRILANVERRGFTSTSCDDPLVVEFRDPSCKIGG